MNVSSTFKLNNGNEIPVMALGSWDSRGDEAYRACLDALSSGYRHIDTAAYYENEALVGAAVRDCKIPREEIFVTTKMWTSDYGNGDAAINASLERLGLDYIDLMILHHSQPENDVAAYKAMEQAVADGRLKAIGLSNYYDPDDFDRVVNATTILPAVLQNETHPYHQSTDTKEHIAQYGTVLESWFPLGGRGNTQTLFNDPVITAIAAAHGKTSAQVILRWHLQDMGSRCRPDRKRCPQCVAHLAAGQAQPCQPQQCPDRKCLRRCAERAAGRARLLFW